MVVGVAPQQMRLPESFFANNTNHTLLFIQTEQGKFISYLYPPHVKIDDPIGIIIGVSLVVLVTLLLTVGVCILITINRKLSSKNPLPSSSFYIPMLELPTASAIPSTTQSATPSTSGLTSADRKFAIKIHLINGWRVMTGNAQMLNSRSFILSLIFFFTKIESQNLI